MINNKLRKNLSTNIYKLHNYYFFFAPYYIM